jgi:hypothetical protein
MYLHEEEILVEILARSKEASVKVWQHLHSYRTYTGTRHPVMGLNVAANCICHRLSLERKWKTWTPKIRTFYGPKIKAD